MSQEIVTKNVGEIRVPVLSNQINGSLLSVEKLTEHDWERVSQLSRIPSLIETKSLQTYGYGAQKKVNEVLDKLLDRIKTEDLDLAGDVVAGVENGIKDLRLVDMRNEAEGKGVLVKLPVVGSYFSAFSAFCKRKQAIKKHFDDIEVKAGMSLGKLNSEVSGLDQLKDTVKENIHELKLIVLGGQEALKGFRDQFEEAKEKALVSNDPEELVELNDMAEQINLFETRMVKLAISISDNLTQLPQIRDAQQAARIQAANIIDSLMTDIPRVKSAIIRMSSLNQIRQSDKTTKARKRIATEISKLAVDAYETTFIESKRTQGDFSDELESLEYVVGKIKSTTDQALDINNQNRENRKQAISRIITMRDDLTLTYTNQAAKMIAG